MSQIDQFGTNKNVIKKWIMSRSDGKGKVNNYFESKEDRDNDVSGRRKKGLPPQPYITDFNLEDTDKTGIATIGFLSEHPRIVEFRRFMASWFLCDFSPHLVKTQYSADPEVHLSSSGDNLGNYVLFLEKKYPERIKSILKKLSTKIPGVKKIQTRRTINGQLLLQFHSTYFKQPFYPQQMSDGTLRLFAYLLLLEDPKPASVLCIDEPENALHHKLIEVLATELRDHADARKNQTQVFVATQEPYFVNALSPQEVWILEKGNDGYTTARRASDDPLVNNFVAEGLQLGSLWYSGYLDAR